jgi:hypothetical protein
MNRNNPVRKEENVNPRTQVKQTEGQRSTKVKPSEEQEEKARQ